MLASFLITYCFPIFGLLTGGFVLVRANPHQLAYSAVRPITSPHLYPTQMRPDENRRDMFERKQD
jgi:hypothetical protein